MQTSIVLAMPEETNEHVFDSLFWVSILDMKQ